MKSRQKARVQHDYQTVSPRRDRTITANAWLSRYRRAVGLAVIILVFAVYCSNRSFVISSDAKGVTASASWIAQGYGLSLNKHLNYQGDNDMYGYWAKRLPDGRVVSIYPIAASVTAAPFFWLAYQFGYSRSVVDEGLLAKWVASLMMSLVCWCCWRIMFDLFSPSIGLTGALLLGLATPLYSTLAQSLWIQTPAILCQALNLFLCRQWLFQRREKTAPWNFYDSVILFVAGIFGAWATACRPNFAIWSVLMVGASLLILRRRSLYYIGGSIAAGVLYLALNKLTYGDLGGEYVNKAAEVGSQSGIVSKVVALAGLLVSPGRGLFIFCPWLILAVAGAVFIFRRKDVSGRWGFWLLLAYSVLTLLVLGSFGQWWGGWSNGPRLQCDFVLPATILCGFPICWLISRLWGIALITSLALPALYLQHNTARMLGYNWEQFAGKSMEEVVSKLWNWRTGNLMWIVSRGLIERELVAEGRDPVITEGEPFDSRREDFSRFIENSLFPYPDRPGHLGARSGLSHLIFRFAHENTQPLTLAGAVYDMGKWGSLQEVEVLINGEVLGTVALTSGSSPKPFQFLIPPEWTHHKPFNRLTFREKYPSTDGGNPVHAMFSDLRLVP